MRICYVCNEYPPNVYSGIGTFTRTLGHVLRNLGHEIIVVGLDQTVSQTQWTDDDGIRVLRIASPSPERSTLRVGRFRLNPRMVSDRWQLTRTVAAVARELEVDVVESYEWSGPLLYAPFHPLVVRLHGANTANAHYEKRRVSRVLSTFERRALLSADRLVAVSQHIADETRQAFGLEATPVDVIYNGVDTRRFAPQAVERSPWEIAFVGTVNRRKGIYDLFRALPRVFETVPQARLSVVGRLPADDAGERLQAELLALLPEPMRPAVTFYGHVPHGDLPAIYSRAAVAVFPSRAEAFGLTCAEAMACGAAVIMTRHASGPEVVEDGVSGLTAAPEQTDALADAMIRLLQNPELRQRLGQGARQRVMERFDTEIVVRQNVALYESVVQRTAAGVR